MNILELKMKKLFFLKILVFVCLFPAVLFSNDDFTGSIYIRFKSQVPKSTIATVLNQICGNQYKQILSQEVSLTEKIKRGENILSYNTEQVKKILAAEEPLLRTYLVEIGNVWNIQKYCSNLIKKYPEIEIAEPVYKDLPLGIPNDPYAKQQTMLSTIKAFDTWDYFQGDTSVVIGIVDTGVLQNHEDISNSIAPNWKEIPNNNIDDDGNGYVDDYIGCNLAYSIEGNGGDTYHTNSHGTSVAGIAGATTNNGKGIAGVAYKCRIFPIKASKLTSSSTIDFSYPGILYAAIRGFSVVNCSWGKVKPFSPIDQSIINYAVARGTVVVAAGGNGNNSTEVWYPAGYDGVLGVGEVNQVDYVTGTTTINETIRIMAPGIGNWITTNQPNGYDSPNYGGTSWSAPVVSGVVAAVRAKYPQLDPLQTIEYVRQLSDDISSLNSSFQYMVPGRVNMKKMLEIEPFSIPGIKPVKFRMYNKKGEIVERFSIGETILLFVDVHNYLGAAKNLRFVLSVADIFDNSLEVVDSEFDVAQIASGEDLTLGPFPFRKIGENTSRTFFRIDIFGEKNYRDFFLIPVIPTLAIATFETDSLKFSIGDKGTIGFYENNNVKYGYGVASKTLGNQIFRGGLMVSEDSSRIVSALFGLNPDGSDFRVIKPFADPDRFTSIIDDSLAQPLEKIGVEIEQKVYLPTTVPNYFKLFIKVKNTSSRTLKNLSLGYYFDWDVGPSAKNNIAYLEPEAIPKTILPIAAAVEFVQAEDSSAYVGVGVYSENSTNLPQMAVLNSEINNSFGRNQQILSLNSGTSIQFKGVDDLALVAGMKFPGEIKPNEERAFTMMIAIGRSRKELIQTFLGNLLQSSVEESTSTPEIKIYPNPTSTELNIELGNLDFAATSYQIIDPLGRILLQGNIQQTIPLESLPNGIYLMKINFGDKTFVQKFVKTH